MTKASLAVLSVAATLLGAMPAFATDPFVTSLPVRNSTAQLTVAFHDDKPTMVTCTPAQVAMLGARSSEHLTELLPVLGARLVGRHTAAGSTIEVLLDAACYTGDIMGLGGYGRGDEKITLPYEESTDGKTWGPPKRTTVTGEGAD